MEGTLAPDRRIVAPATVPADLAAEVDAYFCSAAPGGSVHIVDVYFRGRFDFRYAVFVDGDGEHWTLPVDVEDAILAAVPA